MRISLFRPIKAKAYLSYPWKNAYTTDNIYHGSSVGQKFGQDDVCIDKATHTKYAMKLSTGCANGYESIYQWLGLKGHNGIDIPCDFREPVFAAHDGIVMNVSKDRGKGIGCYVRTLKEFDYKTGLSYFKTGYWHFHEIVVEDGDYVEVGDLLGFGDTTGYSTGNHLHFELKPIYQENGVWQNKEQEMGYYGCADPLPYIIEKDAEDRREELDSIAEKLKIIAEKIKWLFTQINK